MGGKLVKFLVELVVVALIVGWLLMTYPELIAPFMPWLALALLWHLTWEYVLQWKPIKVMASTAVKKAGKMSLIGFLVVGVFTSFIYWYSIKKGLDVLASHHHLATTPPESAKGTVPPQPAIPLEQSEQEKLAAVPKTMPTKSKDDPIGRLSQLGWAVKRDGKLLQFEVANSSLPNMVESATYFNDIREPFRLHFQSVPSLAGLEHLSGIGQCQEVVINASDITGISEIAGFVHLRRLTIGQVPLNTRLDIDSAPLAALVNLEQLSLYGSRFADLAFVGRMSKLKSLSISGTLIRDLSPVATLHSLMTVDVRDSRVSDLAPLAQSRSLKELSIDGKQVETLESLSSGTLENLTLIEHGAVNLAPIGLLTHLDNLVIWGPPALDLTFLNSIPSLSSLQISGLGFGNKSHVLQLDHICSSGSLKRLTMGQLQIESLSFVIRCAKLAEIHINDLPITSINELTGIPTLKKVSLVDVPVIEISPLLSLPNLEELTLIRVPARADVISALERKGVKVSNL